MDANTRVSVGGVDLDGVDLAAKVNDSDGVSVCPVAKAGTRPSIRRSTIIILTAAIALSLYSHYRMTLLGEDYVGVLAPLDRIFDVLLTIGLLVATFCAGRLVSKMLKLHFVSAAEELSFSVLLGTGAISCLIFALGILGMFKPLPIVALFVVILVVARREAVGLYHTLQNLVGAAKGTRRLSFLL